MKTTKTFLILVALLIATLTFSKNAYAEGTAVPSAKLLSFNSSKVIEKDVRSIAIENIFKKYNSPLLGLGATYVKYADKYGVDWKLLPSISGLESSFGQFLMPGSYNGYGWGGGYIYFESWEDGIDIINKTLRGNYMDKWGATDVWSIGPIYAESKTWSVRVNGFMNEIEAEYKSLLAVTPTI